MTLTRLAQIITGHDGPETYIGRHRRADQDDTREYAAAGYSPLEPAVRQELAPTHYASRHLPAGEMDRTGLMPAIPEGGEDR